MASLDSIQALLKDQRGVPPIEDWHPELSGDIDIVIKADGRWIHEGGEIKRHELVKLFSSILRREQDGHYYLVTPVEKWRLQVEEFPLIIVDFEIGAGADSPLIAVKTNVGTWFELGSEHPLCVDTQADSKEPIPSVLTRHGLVAKVNRACFYRLVDLAENEAGAIVLHAGGASFELGSIQ
ncbi:hypothetical protein HNQ57_002797 [Zhongshania antarctica]|uniref:DUF1285 domain-containing protein n=1 Tax=Zhongshania antarctica TaxID=641702 RepID=A0A840R5M6_9GAMM|nr:DUF1285 domain-containing protein [Zhongshania antarctica]MBB5188515.1 hypothetical protein [Zhongshania antarctica]